MSKSLNAKSVLLFFVVFFWFLVIPAMSFSAWTIEAVDAPRFFDFHNRALAIDSSNHPHMAYGGKHLYHSFFDGNTWQYEIVDSALYVGRYSSIAVDSNDKVHISYSGENDSVLKYATNASGSWVTETIETEWWASDTSIAVDSNNKVHISYHSYSDNNEALKYTTNASGSWVTETIDSKAYNGTDTSIAVDSNNKSHISYCGGGADLMYATNAPIFCGNGIIDPDEQCDDGNTFSGDGCSSTCQFEVIVIKVLVPNGGDVLPSGGTYAICWEAPSNAVKFDLRYSTNNGTSWNLIKSVTGLSCTHWEVPVVPVNKKKCRAEVIGYDSNGVLVGGDMSDKPFTIEVVGVISPNGGETLKSGATSTVRWITHKTIRPVAKTVLKYTINGGTTCKTIKTLTGNPESYNWTIPSVPSTKSKCKVKVILKDASGVNVGTDVSDKVFTIQP